MDDVEWEMEGMMIEWEMKFVLGKRVAGLMGNELVMEVEQVMEIEQVVGVVRDGDELVQSEQEAQHSASVYHVCRCTVRHHSEKHLQIKHQIQPDATKCVSPTLLLTWGADHSLLLLPWFQNPLAAYSVWTQNTSACLLIHYSRKRETGNSTVRPDTCKGLPSLYM